MTLVDEGDDINVGECIQLLAEKVGLLSTHNAELIEKYKKENEQLKKELGEHKELAATLEKQANKEKISFGHLEVDKIAAFVLNSETGHYGAIHNNNRGYGNNYYLSEESVSLLTDHLPNRPSYVIGKTVHIKPPPPTTITENFVVTVAIMLPDSTSDHH